MRCFMLFFKQQRCFLVVAYALLLCLMVPQVLAGDVVIKKSPHDRRQYKGIYLDNGLKVLLVSDPNAEKAAAALNVEVGSFNNPADREGLAHFLEHMLFLGTKKYPQASEYSEYISAHGGYNNAWTSNRNTQYYFNILPENLPGGLDRFAQFFIEPMFNVELVDRERHAVNSEYQLSIKKDGWRINEVNNVTANPKHPIVKFSVGSLNTLGDKDKAKPVRDDLLDFYNNYYSADRMCLVVVAPQSIAEQEKLVREYFSAIPKRQVLPNHIEELAFTTTETAKQISIQTIGDYQELYLTFPVPSQRDAYTHKSLDYILQQLQQYGAKSLFQVLKNKNWVSEISAGSEDVTYNQDIAQISFSLTTEGLQHVDDIIQYTFDYLNFMRKIGPQESFFDELRMAGDRNFMYAERKDPMDYAAELPEAMQKYPLEQVLTSGVFTNDTKYEPKKIIELLKYFTPQNMRATLVNNAIQGDLLEPSFNVKYSVIDFKPEQLQKWQTVVDSSDFGLPPKNSFMPQDFSLREKNTAVSSDAVPQEILKVPGISLWHKQDQTYGLPKQNLVFLFAAPDMESTARRALLAKFMCHAINDKATELSTQFSMAGVNANISSNQQGLVLNLSMFSDQQQNVTKVLVAHIKDYVIDPQRFVVYKDDITRELLNFKQNHPFKQALTILNSKVKTPSWLPESLLAEINNVTIADIEAYTQEFLLNVQIISLMHGNITQKDAIHLVEEVGLQLNVDTKRTTNLVLPTLTTLAPGTKQIYKFNPEHEDGTVVSYYQAQETDDKAIALNALLVDLIKVPAFEQLRTKEQLGYVVGVNIIRVREQPGLGFFIESPTKKPKYLNSRWSKFLTGYTATLKKMPATDLETYKSSLVANLLEKPNSLSEETTRYWSLILDGSYRFNIFKEIAQQVSSIQLIAVQKYFNDLLLDPKTMRMVSVESN